MTAAITTPLPLFADLDGSPLDSGFVYIGTAGANPQTSPVAVYFDSALTQPAAQPLRTSGGMIVGPGGAPRRVYVSADDYSITVRTKAGALVQYLSNARDTAGFALTSDLASSASGKGAALIGWLRNATGAIASSLYSWMGWRELSVFEFMTSAQVADVQGYTYALDVTAAVQLAMNAAWTSGRRLHCPAGGYSVTGLTIPGDNTTANKARRFSIYGDSFGEAGVIAAANRGAVFKSSTNAPIFDFTQSAAANGNGEVEISHLAMWGTSSAYVVDLDTFYGLCSLHHCNIVQSGTGGGVRIGWGATYEVHNNYVCGASYGVPSGLGSSRTGIGIYIEQNTSSGGLQSVRKTTVAGWHTCIKVGQGGTAAIAYSVSIDTCEVAYFYRGVHFTDNAEGCTVTKTYFEGIDQGIGVLDQGNYNTVERTWHFFNGGSCTFIDATDNSRTGGRYVNNVFYAYDGASTVCVDVASITGRTKTVSDNTFIQLAGTAGVIGIRMAGANARIDATGNNFSPEAAWSGSGSAQVVNNTTSSDGTTGTGNYALTAARSFTGAVVAPAVGRGAVSLAVDTTTISSVSAGVMTLSELSAFSVDVGAVNITSFAAPNLPDKTFSIHFLANASRPTLKQGSLLKLSGSTDYNVPANGSWHTFQIKAGGVAWETARVAY